MVDIFILSFASSPCYAASAGGYSALQFIFLLTKHIMSSFIFSNYFTSPSSDNCLSLQRTSFIIQVHSPPNYYIPHSSLSNKLASTLILPYLDNFINNILSKIQPQSPTHGLINLNFYQCHGSLGTTTFGRGCT